MESQPQNPEFRNNSESFHHTAILCRGERSNVWSKPSSTSIPSVCTVQRLEGSVYFHI